MYEKLPEQLKKDGRFCLWKCAVSDKWQKSEQCR